MMFLRLIFLNFDITAIQYHIIMKNIFALIAIFICTSYAFAQESQKSEYTIKGDLIQATLFHDNGEVAQTGFYTKDNKLQGEWVSYDANGAKTAVAHYNNGLKVGTWMFFQGNTQKEVMYSNSQIAQVKTWEITDTQVVSNTP